MRHLFLVCILFTSTLNAISAQNFTQIIKGKVFDADTQQPLIGATVQLLNSVDIIATVTDQHGDFLLDDVPIGRRSILINYLGYSSYELSNLEVNSAKEIILEIGLEETVLAIDAVEITASNRKGSSLNDLALISSRSVSPDQTSRYAGGFNDPSKITSNFAGVSNTQDGGNDIIIRGNSPKYVQWRLEGAEITNPNHFGDPNGISGIVGALNNNLLTTSDFYTGAFHAEFGEALSGVYDVRMRKGNSDKFEGVFGLGLLGTDITLEGPLSKNYNGSFLVNYRYSTIGLATDLGLVEVEDANIKFQDAAFKIYLPTQRIGTFSIFGLQGKSSLNFEDVDPSVWITPGNDFIENLAQKDYTKGADLLNLGVNHLINLSSKSYLKTTISYSQDGIKDDVYSTDNIEKLSLLNYKSQIQKSSYKLNSIYNLKLNARHKISGGINLLRYHQKMNQKELKKPEEYITVIDFDRSIHAIRSFVNWKYSPSSKLNFVTGIHNTNVLFNQKHTVEPRISASYDLTKRDIFSFGFGVHSKMESIHNYFAQVFDDSGKTFLPNLELGLLKARHYVLGYDHFFNNNSHVKLEAYFQDLYNIPVEDDENSYYTTLNEGLALNFVELVNEGTGKNYGIEITIEKFLHQGYYYMLNATIYESKYTALDQIERNTRFNGNYIINILAGKEFYQLGKKKNQTFGVNVKSYFGGGRYIVPLKRDEEGNLNVDIETKDIFDSKNAYLSKLDDLLSIAVSLSYKWNKKHTTHELYLNIDNVTNNRARLNEFYDSNATGNIGYEKQVGLVPNFLYRIYF